MRGSDGGFAIINYIKAEDAKALEKVIQAFKNRAGMIESMEGFRSLTILANEERREVLVITVWDDREAFERWRESHQFKMAHERARARRLEGVSSEGVEYNVVEFTTKC